MICEVTVKKYCCEDISKIENYAKAIADAVVFFVNKSYQLEKMGLQSRTNFNKKVSHKKFYERIKQMVCSKINSKTNKGYISLNLNNKKYFACPRNHSNIFYC